MSLINALTRKLLQKVKETERSPSSNKKVRIYIKKVESLPDILHRLVEQSLRCHALFYNFIYTLFNPFYALSDKT